MKVVEMINALNKLEDMFDSEVMIKDFSENYALIKSIGIDQNGDICIEIDKKHYISKVTEHKIEIAEAIRY